MKRIVKKLIKESSIYSLQPIFEKVIVFLLLPIYTAYLSTADYGMLQYIMSIGSFFFLVMCGGLETSFWKYRTDDNHISNEEVALNVLLTQLAIGAFLVILIYLLKDLLFESRLRTLILLYVVAQVVYAVYQNILLVLRADHKAGIYVAISTLYALLLAVSNIYFVVRLKMNYTGIIYGNVLCNVLFSLLLLVFFSKFSGRVNMKLSAGMLMYGAPLVLGNIASTVNALSDRFFLKSYSNATELGLYSFGYQFANLVLVFLVTPFFLGWNPIRWEVYKMENSREIFSRIYKLLLVVLPVAAMVIASLSIIIAIFLVSNKEYLGGFSILTTIAFSHVFFALYYFNSMGMLFKNKTKVITGIALAAALLNLVMNFILTPKFGMRGAAISSLASYFTMFVLSGFFCQKYYPFEKSRVSEISLIVFIAAMSFATIFLFTKHILNPWTLSLFIFCSSGVLIFIGFVTGQIRISDFSKLKHLFVSGD